MDLTSVPLCLYCGVALARVNDPYCCDGCQVLDEIGGSAASTRETAELPEDTPLTRAFGSEEGSQLLFECYVDPLACEACLQGLARLQTLVPEVTDIQWNRTTSVLGFRFHKSHARPTRVYLILEKLHLAPRWKSPGETAPARARRERLMRLGITAALAGNLMLFSVPIYAGLAGSLQTLFEIIQAVVFLPVLFWSALPFFRTAWMSLRLRQLSVDLPLVVAFLAGSGFSYMSLFSGGHEIYFDSLTGFLLLILWSRSLLEGSLVRYLESPQLEQFFDTPLFRVTRGGETFLASWKDIRKGDEVELQSGDRIPVDATLLSDAVQIETAWMTGEKVPFWRLDGSRLQAGGRLVSKDARVRAENSASETEFAALLRRLGPGSEKIGIGVEARIGSALVVACFVSIAILFLFGGSLGFDELLRRSVALLIVACPCAVSFAAPLARAKAGKIALRLGFWVRNPVALERLLSLRRIAFDKTGTLTGGLFVLSQHSPMIDPHWKRIILSLENISNHPIAESLRRAWGALPLAPVENAREVLGFGVAGTIEGADYELKGSEDAEGRLGLELTRNGTPVVHLLLQDEATSATETALTKLHRRYELFIISGDRPSRVRAFGQRYGFDEAHTIGGLTPAAKVEALSKIRPDVYFGDGTNDIPALQSAPVAIAVPSATLEARAAADVLMLGSQLGRSEDLFELARATKALNRRNLVFALAYNILAGAASVLGLIQPFAAAVLMPVASVVLLLSTLRGNSTLRRLGRSA